MYVSAFNIDLIILIILSSILIAYLVISAIDQLNIGFDDDDRGDYREHEHDYIKGYGDDDYRVDAAPLLFATLTSRSVVPQPSSTASCPFAFLAKGSPAQAHIYLNGSSSEAHEEENSASAQLVHALIKNNPCNVMSCDGTGDASLLAPLFKLSVAMAAQDADDNDDELGHVEKFDAVPVAACVGGNCGTPSSDSAATSDEEKLKMVQTELAIVQQKLATLWLAYLQQQQAGDKTALTSATDGIRADLQSQLQAHLQDPENNPVPAVDLSGLMNQAAAAPGVSAEASSQVAQAVDTTIPDLPGGMEEFGNLLSQYSYMI